MKIYLTWGVGYGKSKALAQTNAQLHAVLDKIKITKLEKLEVQASEVLEDKTELSKLKGSFPGIVLQNCAKGEVAAALFLCKVGDKIFIGHGKAGSLAKAYKKANYEVLQAAKDKNVELRWSIGAHAPPKKDTYGCAIVALVLVNSSINNSIK
ncbi:MAG: hypothetical protein ACP5IJ_00150 [Candidatus Nanoarchaeia archaeon]